MIAFVGPSIPRDLAASLCPGLDLRPPIRRGDLYRERERGAWGFLIVDGVFMAEQAVSPREVVDVLADGALVIGAASMGALRAADCWPAGAVGVGVIYRLYRWGILESDEEVAVAVRTDGSDLPASVPLVNVRHAVARAVRRRLLDRQMARAIVEEAASIFYPQRTWREVLGRVGVTRPEVHKFCAALDLKRNDAERALARVRRLLAQEDLLASRHQRVGRTSFLTSEETRERGYDVSGGVAPERLAKLLVDWLLGSGRIHHFRFQLSAPVERVVSRPEAYARRIWRDLARAGEIDAELMRMKAIRAALMEAERTGLTPRDHDLRVARREIANNHGFTSWDALVDSPAGEQLRDVITTAADQLARAKRVRDAWFNPS